MRLFDATLTILYLIADNSQFTTLVIIISKGRISSILYIFIILTEHLLRFILIKAHIACSLLFPFITTGHDDY